VSDAAAQPRRESTLRVLRLDPRALLPTRAHPGDAGLDLHAVEPAELGPGQRTSVGTGLAIEVPPGQAALVVPRSGLAARHGISVVNSPGLIDSGYRGELRVLLLNTDPHEAFRITPGDRIAQLVLIGVELPEPVEVQTLDASARGVGGFGSSGGFGTAKG
jgi:dUTP pyrophosphatase